MRGFLGFGDWKGRIHHPEKIKAVKAALTGLLKKALNEGWCGGGWLIVERGQNNSLSRPRYES